jgi:hypothetical protein
MFVNKPTLCTAALRAALQWRNRECWAGNDPTRAQSAGEIRLGPAGPCSDSANAIYTFTLNTAVEGCYRDSVAARALPALVNPPGDTTLTQTSCALRAAAAGYDLYGTQYNRECFAGGSGTV